MQKEVNQTGVGKVVPDAAASVAVVDVAMIKKEVLADIAFVRSAVKRRRMKWVNHAMIYTIYLNEMQIIMAD